MRLIVEKDPSDRINWRLMTDGPPWFEDALMRYLDTNVSFYDFF